jgi:hypothetical protein
VTVPASATELAASGYKLYMDGANDGNFAVVHDGTGVPGVLELRLTEATHGIKEGLAYRFKVTSLNYNGEGPASAEALLYMCLPPADFAAPIYVSSSTSTLNVGWSSPSAVNGCPLSKF